CWPATPRKASTPSSPSARRSGRTPSRPEIRPMIPVVEQVLNGVQFGVMLFLMAAGLTLVFGIMNLINLAHGSIYMVGAYVAAAAFAATGSFLVGLAAALGAAVILGVAIEIVVFRRLYGRDHLDQVLATFGLIL